MKKHKTKIIIGAVIAVILAAVFWWGGNAPGLQGWTEPASLSMQETTNMPETVPAASDTPVELSQSITPESTTEPKKSILPECTPIPEQSTVIKLRPGGTKGGLTAQEKLDLAAEMAGEAYQGVESGDVSYSQSQGMIIDSATGKDKYLTDPVPEGKPVPVEPQNVVITDKAYTCTLSVRCDTILKNMNWLDPEKVELVPKDGVIFAKTEVTFYEGESVFNVLMREMKKNKIHLEFVNTPMYNSTYIEGIGNLYEFDCGELSGWMYKINNWFPNYGCSRYKLKPGDVVEWVYTCDLGIDVGGYQAIGG